MIDTTRAVRITGAGDRKRAGYDLKDARQGPAEFLAEAAGIIMVRARDGTTRAFRRDGSSVEPVYQIALENIQTKVTNRYYARRSASRPNEIKLQTVRPQVSIGEIEIDVEGDRIVGARVVS